MYKSQVIRYFSRGRKNTAGALARCAKLLEISSQAAEQWNEIIPRGWAYELEVLTAGGLKVDRSLYPRRTRRSPKMAAAEGQE